MMQNERSIPKLDIIVVGAGMVGLSVAIALYKIGFKVLVVEGRGADLVHANPAARCSENQDQIASYDNRVSALTRASENIFKNLGVWQKIVKMRLCPYRQMVVWDGDGTGCIDFSSAALHEPNLGHIVENSVVVAALHATAVEIGLEIVFATKVVDLTEPVEAERVLHCEQLDKKGHPQSVSYGAKLLIGADGALSKIRQLAAIPLWQRDYGHHAIVASVKTQLPHQNTAWQRFTSDGPLAFLPLSDPFTSSIVYSTSPEHASALMALSESDFKKALGRDFEAKLGEVVEVAGRAVFPLRQRHAKQYVQPGLALIGDAIHTIHPLAGQGVNLGLLDVASLVQVLSVAKERGRAIGEESLLKKYQRDRHGENLKMSATMQAFKWLFDPQPAPVIIARNFGMKLLNKAPPLKQHIMAQALGLSGDLPELARSIS